MSPLMSDSTLHRRALLLSYFTITYNVVEFFLSLVAGILSGSIALVGFGLDSLVESFSAGIMVWRFRRGGTMSEEEEERIEQKAEKLIGYTFLLLAAYVLYESVNKLVRKEIPEPSLLGMFIAFASMVVMPVLYRAKLRTGKALNSKSLVADSKETLACAFLSVALLIGLGANYLFGFWQADSLVGLVIAVFLAREGFEIVRGEHEKE
jgi:cation diffusion facilitator family transporter